MGTKMSQTNSNKICEHPVHIRFNNIREGSTSYKILVALRTYCDKRLNDLFTMTENKLYAGAITVLGGERLEKHKKFKLGFFEAVCRSSKCDQVTLEDLLRFGKKDDEESRKAMEGRKYTEEELTGLFQTISNGSERVSKDQFMSWADNQGSFDRFLDITSLLLQYKLQINDVKPYVIYTDEEGKQIDKPEGCPEPFIARPCNKTNTAWERHQPNHKGKIMYFFNEKSVSQDGLNADDVKRDIELAIGKWNAALKRFNTEFVEAKTVEEAHVHIKFSNYDVGNRQFDGAGGVLAEANSRALFLDSNENWVTSSSPNNLTQQNSGARDDPVPIGDAGDAEHGADDFPPVEQRTYCVFNVVLHELGHVLGLSHAPCTDSVMRPYYSNNATEVTKKDEEQLAKMYTPANAEPTNGKAEAMETDEQMEDHPMESPEKECPQCKKPATGKFCCDCGTETVEKTKKRALDGGEVECACGKRLAPTSNFCSGCGNSIRKVMKQEPGKA